VKYVDGPLMPPADGRRVYFDRRREVLVINGRLRDREDSDIVLHESDLVGVTVVQLSKALRVAEEYWGAYQQISIADTEHVDFDPEYVNRGPYYFVVTESKLALLWVEFFNSRYEDEGFGMSECQSILAPILKRYRLSLELLEPHSGYMGGPPYLWQAAFRFTAARRPLEAIRDGAHEILALLEAYDNGVMSRSSARELLRSGNPHALIGQPESIWLEAKTTHYDLSRLQGKVDLSLAVAKFANNPVGGLVVVGLRTKRVPNGEAISAVTPVPRNAGDGRRYRHVLGSHLYPPPEALEIFTVDSGEGQLVVIDVPPQPEESKPFLVHGAIVDGKGHGAFIGIVRRDGDDSIPTTAPMIHATLAAGRALLRGSGGATRG